MLTEEEKEEARAVAFMTEDSQRAKAALILAAAVLRESERYAKCVAATEREAEEAWEQSQDNDLPLGETNELLRRSEGLNRALEILKGTP